MQVSHEVDEVLSLVTTVGSEADARRLARGLVEARLAACVQVEPGLQSHYRWQGELQADAQRVADRERPRREHRAHVLGSHTAECERARDCAREQQLL